MRKSAEAHKAYMRKWFSENRERRRVYLREWYRKNREKILAVNKRWRSENPERRKSHIEKYASKPETKLAKRNYYLENKEKCEVKSKRWRENNPDLVRASRMARKSRVKKARLVSRIDLKAVKARCGFICGICSHKIDGAYHYDHIIPLNRGGFHCAENLQMAHPVCNMRKKDRIGYKLPSPDLTAMPSMEYR